MPPGRRTQPSGRLLPRAQLRHRFFGDVLRGLRGVDHAEAPRLGGGACAIGGAHAFEELVALALDPVRTVRPGCKVAATGRSEEHTSELQSLMRISYAVFCLTKKNNDKT